MKTLFLFLFTAFFLFSFVSDEPKKIIFFGDSITQAGVNPGGYITLLKDLYSKANNKSELIGAGIGGNKVYDLFLRMEEDVLLKKPNVVVIYVGVNDVWHKASYGTGTDQDKFTKFYTAIISKMKAQGIQLILTTPAAIGEKTDHSNQQDGDLNQYSNIIRGLAKEHNCGLVDLRKEFLAFNMSNNPENKDKGILTTDRVHLNEAGNKLVAELMFKELQKIK
jgi:lysophospholipase L1-like esterase